MKRYFFICLSFLFFLVVVGSSENVFADENTNYDVKVHYLYNNNPIYSVQVVAKNYDLVQKKLTTGKFTKSDFEHFSISKLKANYTVKGHKVIINDKIAFGKNISLTKEEAFFVIAELYKNNLDFLDYINEFGPQVILRNPENKKYKFTNKKGLSIGKIQEGVTVFVSSVDPKDIIIKDINKNQDVYMGNTQKLSGITLTSDHKSSTTVDGLSVDYGQTVTYKIPIKHLDTMYIDVSPNFVIESINYPYEQSYQINPVQKGERGKLTGGTSLNVVDNILDYKIDEEDRKSDRLVEIAKKLSKLQSIYRLKVDLTGRSHDYLEIKGHVTAKAQYQIKTQISNDTRTEVFSETYDVFNSKLQQGIFVNDGKKFYETPQLSSYNINFAMYDSHNNTLTTGGKYVLGKIDKHNNFYVYSGANNGKPKWIKQSVKFNERLITSKKESMVIKGNNNYYIDGQKQSFELDTSVWDFNAKKQKKMFKSLFSINGLSSYYKYVLYQVGVPDNYKLKIQPIIFKVSEESEKKAQFSNYQINGDILGMEYNENEYNALSLNPKNKKVNRIPNPYVMTVLGISIIVLIASTILTLLLKIK
ncbi:hypothetical protein [Streptococcus halotolerans]|uniref:hypothetical protein n=1 Tax=Streptococcus halotolerans TaxID=1814128 RepID=UPI00078903DA|nr:hypothetical protein [Streptococcus halotolerans]